MIPRAELRQLERVLRHAVRDELRDLLLLVVDAMAASLATDRGIPMPAPITPTQPELLPVVNDKNARRPKRRAPPAAAAAPSMPPPVADPPPAEPIEAPAPPIAPEPPAVTPAVPPAAPQRLVPSWAPPPPAPAPRPTLRRAEPEVESISHKGLRIWLARQFRAGGLGQIAAEDKVAPMTHDQVLIEANRRRQRSGDPPFVFLGTGGRP